ncbi:hypothetical protein, partial [Acidithiobacillus sp.]|uniref:hypothetical protein n=1 Tax=Acidithiobacillus sp. TaxID=1872118 RepID=UPI002582A09C
APSAADAGIMVDQNEIAMEVYTHGEWSSERRVALGGTDANGNIIPFLSCRGILCDQDDAPTTDPIPDSTFYRFDFEGDMQDQHGIDPWTINLGAAGFGDNDPWEGTYALSTPSAMLNAEWPDVWNAGDDVTAAFMFRTSAFVTVDILEWNASSGNDRIGIELTSGGYIRGTVAKGGAVTTDTSSLPISANAWHFIGISYDDSTGLLHMRVDDDDSTTETSGAWSGLTDLHFYLTLAGTGYEERIDDLIISHETAIDPDVFFQHVDRGQPWTTDMTAKDILVKPKTGGRLVIDSPVAGEPSFGTFHEQVSTLWADVDPSAATAYVTCASVPNGAKAVYVRGNMLSSSTAGRTISIREITADSHLTWFVIINPTTAIYGYGNGIVPLDSSKRFAVYPNNADINHVNLYKLGYFI